MQRSIPTVIISMILFFSGHSLSAQGVSLEVGFNYVKPGGTFEEIYTAGAGASVNLRYNVNDKLAVGAVATALGFDGDYQVASNPTRDVQGVILNLAGTAQYKFFDRDISPFCEFGMGLYSVKDGSIDFEEYTKDFGYSPKIGLMLDFLNVHLSYHAVGKLNYIQAGLGFRIGQK